MSLYQDECVKIANKCVGEEKSEIIKKASKHGVQRPARSACVQKASNFQQTHLLPNEKFKQVKEIIETSILNPHPSRWPTEVMVGEGESSGLKLSTGSLAKLADGAAVAQVKDSRRRRFVY